MSNNLPATSQSKTPFLSNELYDRLKFFAMVVLPAVGSLYFGLAGIWGLPKPEEVVGTIVVLDTFLGVVLGLSSKRYNEAAEESYDGTLEINAHDSSIIHTLELTTAPEELGKKNTIVLRVSPKQIDLPDDLDHP